MGFSIKSNGQFSQKLREIISRFRGITIAAKITLPEEMKWWYFQEFGTAAAYEIDPTSAAALRLPATAEHPEEILVPRVGPPYTQLHPPIQARHMIGKVEDEIVQTLSRAVAEALHTAPYDAAALHGALVDQTMPKAVDLITQSFEENLPGSEPDGQLKGESAADAFASSAEIIDLST